MDQKLAQEFLDSIPEEELLDFDPFLIGDGNFDKYGEYLSGGSRKFQLTGIDATEDLYKEPSGDLLGSEDDFPEEQEDLYEAHQEAYQSYYQAKKFWYDTMDFTVVKSSLFSSPVTEENLIMSSTDKYLVKYLFENKYNKSSFSNLGQLSAITDMRISDVQIVSKCTCPLCVCLDLTVIPVKKLYDLISSKSALYSHEFYLVPVIYSRDDLWFNSVKDYKEGDCNYLDVPMEFYSQIGQISEKNIRFTDLRSLDDWKGEVVVKGDDYLLVHNGFIHNKSPIDFISEYLFGVTVKKFSEETDEIYFVKGKKAKLVNGVYVDIDTGEILL